MLENQEWYTQLVGDLEAIVVERVFEAEDAKVNCYHEVGERILTENDNFERASVYGESIVAKIAKSLHTSKRTIYYSIAFAKQYPDMNLLPIGKDMTWSKVIKLLTTPKEEEALPALPTADKLEKIINDYLPWMITNLTQNKKGINLFLPNEKIEYEIENSK